MKQVNEVFKMKVGDRKEIGAAELDCIKVEVDNTTLMMQKLREIRDRGTDLFCIENGTYTRLKINGTVFMSDTPMELKSNSEVINKATGKVFIGGLGIGLLLHNLMEKIEKGIVTEIFVAENNLDVIKLIGPYYKHPKIKLWHADINNMIRNPVYTGYKFDTIYLDIWSKIGEDEYEEMKKLQRIFKYHFLNKNNPNCYINCWMKDFLAAQKRKGNL